MIKWTRARLVGLLTAVDEQVRLQERIIAAQEETITRLERRCDHLNRDCAQLEVVVHQQEEISLMLKNLLNDAGVEVPCDVVVREEFRTRH